MRLAVVNLTGGGLSGGGLKTMTSLIPRLVKHPLVKEAHVYVPQRVAQLCSSSQLNLFAWSNLDWFVGYRPLRHKIRSFAPDVIFIPNGTWLNFGKIPTVTMIRNMEAIAEPFGDKPYRSVMKNLLRRSWAKLACQKATRIIAVSQFVQEYLVSNWNISQEKIDIVHHGTDPAPSLDTMKKPIALQGKQHSCFFFAAGSLVPYRGFEDIIEATAMLNKKGELSSYKFFIAGESLGKSSKYKAKLRNLADRNGIGSSIVWLGQLSAAEMSWCYHNCEAFIMPSRLEACPNLVLESLSHGCINISTCNAPMPEFFGDAAFYYQADRPWELKDLILKVVGLSSTEKQRLQERSRNIAKQFTWTNTTEKTMMCLQDAIQISSTRTDSRL